MIRKLAIVAIATAGIAGSQFGTSHAANAAPPSFLGGSYGVTEVDATGNTVYVGSANGGVWKTTDGGPSEVGHLLPAVQKVAAPEDEPQTLLPAIQIPREPSRRAPAN